MAKYERIPQTIKGPSGKDFNLTRLEDGVPFYTRTEIDKDGVEHTYALRFRIRKLTPRESLRLMAVTDDRIDQMMKTKTVKKKKNGKVVMVEEQMLSNTQLYRQAGNSIVVNCLTHVFSNIFYRKQKKS